MMTTLTMKEDDEKCSAGSPVATPLGPPSTGAHNTQISASSTSSSSSASSSSSGSSPLVLPVSPAAPIPKENPVPAPLDNSIHDLSIPDVKHEPVIHPGGGDAVEHLDVHKVTDKKQNFRLSQQQNKNMFSDQLTQKLYFIYLLSGGSARCRKCCSGICQIINIC